MSSCTVGTTAGGYVGNGGHFLLVGVDNQTLTLLEKIWLQGCVSFFFFSSK